ncbi:MAG: SO2930 family diheme c-type cytochrome [Myxococcota bacterium]
MSELYFHRFLLAASAAALLCACGDDGDDGDAGADGPAAVADACAIADGTEVNFDPRDERCQKLSSYRFFVGNPADQVPNQRVVPYDLTTPLYADYTVKYRFVYLPEGTSMTYHERESFDLPVGAVLIKTFADTDDLRQPAGARTLLETRLLYRDEDGWAAETYVWDGAQSEATQAIAGANIDAQWVHSDGQVRTLNYSVPNQNQCKNCHEERDDLVGPLGPKARYLNRQVPVAGQPRDQLQHLAELGLVTGLPADPAAIPRAPVWDDPATGSLDERARAWLDMNCAHCHNPRGAARTSGLDLSFDQDSPYEFGVCKGPVAAGGGSGGFLYNIVPGQPDQSILVYRLETDKPDERMPEVGRQLQDEEGVALIREWIAAMEPDECGGSDAAPE